MDPQHCFFVIILIFSRAYLFRTNSFVFTFRETAVVVERWQRTFNETLGRYQQLTDQLASGDQAAHMLPILWKNQLDQVTTILLATSILLM
jgi:hypothetical protein